MLITLPTFLYLVTGLSQVMLSVECIVKYHTLGIEDNQQLSPCSKRISVERANLLLKYLNTDSRALKRFNPTKAMVQKMNIG